MEVSGAIETFQRSESLHGLRYTQFLGDSDARAYKAVNEMQPYEDIGIEKLECVGYVDKWMGTRLRALKLKMKARAMETANRERLRKANYDILQNSKEARILFREPTPLNLRKVSPILTVISTDISLIYIKQI
ncbi:hypothetical protein TNCV_3206211 [Trichonephila clavipes]|nr:hypothetical protein TNCV_3206211 [Trichonephila clavipes]